MFLENTLATLEEVLQMILCKFETNKLCSQYVFSCLKAQLSCSKFCNCHGSMSWYTWTTLDQNSDGKNEYDVKKADENVSADEQQRWVSLCDTAGFSDLSIWKQVLFLFLRGLYRLLGSYKKIVRNRVIILYLTTAY